MQHGGKNQISQTDINRLMYLMGIADQQGHQYPWYARYFNWLFSPDKPGVDFTVLGWHIHGGGLLTLNWGKSITLAQGVQVTDLIGQRLPFTLILMGVSLLFSLIIAIPIGIISAVKQYSKLDYTVTLFSFFGISMPVFWFAWMLIIVFAQVFKAWHDTVPWLSWLPYLPNASAYTNESTINDLGDRARHLVLPVIVLSLLSIAGWSRFLRSSVLEVLRLDYVRTAWAKGLKQRVVILKHALRNALIPLITVITLALPGLFGGAIDTESVFSYPGMGRLFLDALGAFDWPIVMAILVISAALVIIGNILADVLYAVTDPRIRYS
jgi:peptide/nickel transport system permease protein